jgi:hypothetical protein
MNITKRFHVLLFGTKTLWVEAPPKSNIPLVSDGSANYV